VGYGKTEVALRAAFMAVFNGKQVAVLVPTTVLAEQHYDTFQQRFKRFGVQIESLSRFRSRASKRTSSNGWPTAASIL
jgi:transcription-repair coupling factor (superfamily II helicase)